MTACVFAMAVATAIANTQAVGAFAWSRAAGSATIPPTTHFREQLMAEKKALGLAPSETVVVRAAATIYAAYIAAGKVPEGQQEAWMKRSIQEAFFIARTTDDAIVSDNETW